MASDDPDPDTDPDTDTDTDTDSPANATGEASTGPNHASDVDPPNLDDRPGADVPEYATGDDRPGAGPDSSADDGPLPLFGREDDTLESRADFRAYDHDLVELLRAPTRLAVIVTLATAPQPMTVEKIVEWTDDVSRSTFSEHRPVLVEETGVIEAVGQRHGGAVEYELNRDNPVAAALEMAATLVTWERTPVTIPAAYLAAGEGAAGQGDGGGSNGGGPDGGAPGDGSDGEDDAVHAGDGGSQDGDDSRDDGGDYDSGGPA